MITDLPEEIASRTPQPPFEAVVARVRADRRRALRRTAIGGALLAATAYLVVPHLGGDPADPGPTKPSPSPKVLGEVASISGADDGGVAALRQNCPDSGGACTYAVFTSDGSAAPAALVVESDVLSPTPRGWLVHTGDGWRELTSDGSVSVVEPAGPDGVQPGDVVVQTAAGAELLRGDRLLLLPKRSDSVSSSYVTPSGRLMQTTYSPTGHAHLVATRDGTHWATIRTWAPAADLRVAIAGRGRTIAAVVLSIGTSGRTAIQQVDVSHDSGQTWATARGIDFSNEVRDLSSTAVSAQGTVYLTTGSDGLIRIDADGNARRTPVSDHDQAVFTTTYDVCVLGSGRLHCSDDDGTTWAGRIVPGIWAISGE